MRKLLNEELPRLTVEGFWQETKNPIIIVLDNVRSHTNVGAIFRTADAFLLQGIYLCGITGQPPHRDIHKTALGATETVYWQYFTTTSEAVKALRQQGYQILAVEQAAGSTMLHRFAPVPGQPYAIVLGNEVAGVAQDIVSGADRVIEIPQYGTKHSLNIAVSTGIVVWDMVSKLQSASAQ